MTDKPRMYHDLAEWFHLLTAPEDYEEEAELFYATAEAALERKPQSWLELGSGGGNNAWHYSKRVPEVVLSDRSAEMLAISKSVNPKVEHIQGDMLEMRLGRTFDVVFVHDAASYLTTEEQVRQLAESVAAHCKVGGVALICPDETAENLELGTDHGGHDGDGRAMRYLEWSSPGTPGTYEYVVDYAYIYHVDGEPPRVELDRHVNGALPEAMWLQALRDAGFNATTTPFIHSEVPEGSIFFVGRRTA